MKGNNNIVKDVRIIFKIKRQLRYWLNNPISSFVNGGMRHMYAFVLFMSCFSFSYAQTGPDPNDNPFKADLTPTTFKPTVDELLNLTTSTREEKPIPLNSFTTHEVVENPGSVQIFQREDIEATGATNLQELLEFFAGFAIVSQNSVFPSLGIRGTDGTFGRYIIMIDENIVNTNLFHSYNLGVHIPLSIIDKIAIVKGAAATRYGGRSGLAVIRIYTFQSEARKNIRINVHTGASNNTASTEKVSFQSKQKFSNGLSYKMTGAYYNGKIFNYDYKDFLQRDVSYSKTPKSYGALLNMGFAYKGLSVDFLGDFHQFNNSYLKSFTEDDQFFLTLNYEREFTDYINMTATIGIKQQTNIFETERFIFGTQLDVPDFTNKTTGNIYNAQTLFDFKILKDFHLHLGGNAESERTDIVSSQTGIDSLRFEKFNVIGELDFKRKWIHIVASARESRITNTENGFSYRVAAIKKIGPFRLKYQYANSITPPRNVDRTIGKKESFENSQFINHDAEIIYNPKKWLFISGKFFQSEFKFPLFVNPSGNAVNEDVITIPSGKTVQGFEIDVAIRPTKRLNIKSNYSFYRNTDALNSIAVIPTERGTTAGIPTQKVLIYGTYNLSPRIDVSGSAVLNGDIKNLIIDPVFGPVPYKVDNSWILNTKVTMRNVFTKNISMSLYGKNILNKKQLFTQAAINDQYPLAKNGFEVIFEINFDFNSF